MGRQYYLELARQGLCMPIGSDLVLHDHHDAEEILLDGDRLGSVFEETAQQFRTPLAIPRMDLELEKLTLCHYLGYSEEESAKFHFSGPVPPEVFATLEANLLTPFPARMQANVDAISYIARETELLPVGMCIGPLSFMTKLVSDPITPICLAGSGLTAEDDDEVQLIEQALDIGLRIIMRSLAAQVAAGAKAIFIAEPAANKVYFSPNQLDAGSDIFERYVMKFNRQIADYLSAHQVDLIFHCCGELTEYMLRQFTTLRPAMLSLGSSRVLWEDAAIVPKDIVLYGNLPSKQFYSDALITKEQISERSIELLRNMEAVGHPFILGSECDVLSVPGCEQTIREKAFAMMFHEPCACLVA